MFRHHMLNSDVRDGLRLFLFLKKLRLFRAAARRKSSPFPSDIISTASLQLMLGQISEPGML
jgi:hypothetical protein